MMTHKITPFLDYNKWLKKRLDIQLNEQTNQNSIKVPKVVKTLGTSEINSPMPHPSLRMPTVLLFVGLTTLRTLTEFWLVGSLSSVTIN